MTDDSHAKVTNTERTPLHQSEARLTGGRVRSMNQHPLAVKLGPMVGVRPTQLRLDQTKGIRDGWSVVFKDGSTRPVGVELVERALASMVE